MRIYLDMCCLKRPFDDQSFPRNRLESEAVLALLASESPEREFIRSDALVLENTLNPIKERAARVDQWLRAGKTESGENVAIHARIVALVGLGLKNFDALHIAVAEHCNADVFGTCDDKLLAAAKRNAPHLKVRVLGIVELAGEVLK